MTAAQRFVGEGAYVFIIGLRQVELDNALTGSNATDVQGDVADGGLTQV
ncbi:MAG TPA: hypothetical protein VK463_06165 [Desulfomonilaceae bacterium]|nr:hypothetical protein [Desulfomonilaceae bacterium]